MPHSQDLLTSKNGTQKNLIIVTGATGFVGQALVKTLLDQHQDLSCDAVVIVGRKAASFEAFPYPVYGVVWDFENEPNPPAAWSQLFSLHQVNAVVHLAGESVAAERWSPARKERILKSRELGTRNLVAGLVAVSFSGVFVGGSAVGFYGENGADQCDESRSPGAGFLAEVCKVWEHEALALQEKTSARVVVLRIGVVLGATGGALFQLRPLVRKRLAGVIGDGEAWMSWVHLDDLCHMIVFAIKTQSVTGIYNAVAPHPVTNTEFTRAVHEAMKLECSLPVPEFMFRLALGEMAAMALTSIRASAQKIIHAGFVFKHDHIGTALNSLHPNFESLDDEFISDQWVPTPIDQIFEFFSDAKNLEAITPEFLNFKIDRVSSPNMADLPLIDYSLKIHGVPVHWQTKISEWVHGQRFVDEQLKGPYTKWHHTHRFREFRGGTLIEDRVLFRLPLKLVGELVGAPLVRRDVTQIFEHRFKTIKKRFGEPVVNLSE